MISIWQIHIHVLHSIISNDTTFNLLFMFSNIDTVYFDFCFTANNLLFQMRINRFSVAGLEYMNS